MFPCIPLIHTNSVRSLPARPPEHLIGRSVGQLTVRSLEHVHKHGKWLYSAICECVCGRTVKVWTSNLGRGTMSCGFHKGYEGVTGENNASFKGYREIRASFWNGYRFKANRRGLPFDLTIEYAWDLFETQQRKCAFTGVPLCFGPISKPYLTTASIDRIDNSLGYVEGNVQWVHKIVNMMRGPLSVEDFTKWSYLVTRSDN